MMRGVYEHLPETDEALVYACMAYNAREAGERSRVRLLRHPL
jgi:hypothetical protein